VFKVKCITHRKDPVMLGVISQFPPSESSMIKVALLESNLLAHLTKALNIPGIADVHALEAGGCTATLWVSVKKIYAGQIDQLALGVWGYMGMSYFKWIVVTDDDIDIRDPFMRDWVMAWRVRPDKDMRILTDTAAVELDPASLLPDVASEDIRGGKALIDATKKWGYPDVSLPPLGQLRKVAAGWSKYGLPPLGELKLPKAGE
jgi:4-hydroxy-3-polyprenylbenzoate decarboxylase